MKAYVEPEEVALMEEATTNLRDRLLVRLLFRLGCRISEALALKTKDIDFDYKEALTRATAREHAERIISEMVVSGADVTEEDADKIYQRELKKGSRKFTHMRYHSFLMYFGVLKRLGWVEATGETENSSIQDNYPSAPNRTYYRLTPRGKRAGDKLWSYPLFTLYPKVGQNHMKKSG